MSTLTTLPQHLQGVSAQFGDLGRLRGAKLVAISSVMFPDVSDHGYDTVRFEASVKATRAYAHANIPQIVMVDPQSDPKVAVAFGQAGAIVVATPRGGVATPYLDAAHLARAYAGWQVNVLKAEADKKFTRTDITNIQHLLERGNDVLVGDRSVSSMQSMTAIQESTEAILDGTIASMLRIPRGATSGVQAYSPKGLEIFLAFEDLLGRLGNNWKYLLYVPAMARVNKLRVVAVPITVRYDDAMVKMESDDSATHLKRLEQLLLMMQGMYEVAELLKLQLAYLKPRASRLAEASKLLAKLRDCVKR